MQRICGYEDAGVECDVRPASENVVSGEIGKRSAREDLAKLALCFMPYGVDGTEGDPMTDAGVCEAGIECHRPFDALDHIEERDRLRFTAERDAAPFAAIRSYQALPGELRDDLAKEYLGNIPFAGDVCDLDRGAGRQRGEMHHRADGVFTCHRKLEHRACISLDSRWIDKTCAKQD